MKQFARPEAWWGAIEPHFYDRRLALALLALAVLGALFVAIACEIGVRYFNTDWNQVFGYKVQRNRDWRPFMALWGGLTLVPLAQGLVAAALLPVYSLPRQWLRAVAVAIIGYLPMYVAAIALVLLPGIFVFAIAFVISCGWWASGNRRLLGVSDNDSAEHVAVSLAASGVLVLLTSATFPL